MVGVSSVKEVLRGCNCHPDLASALNQLGGGAIVFDGTLTPVAAEIAALEGWGVFWNEERGRQEIQKLDAATVPAAGATAPAGANLDSDALAVQYVAHRASAGSELHRIAIAIHHNNGETRT